MEDHLNFLITFENTIKYDHIYPRFALSSSPHIFPNMSPPNFLSFRFYNSLSSVSAVDVFVGSGWSTGGQENLSVGTRFLHMIWWCVEKNSKSSAKRSWKTIRWLSKFMVLDQNLSCFREIHRLSPTHPLSSLSQMLPPGGKELQAGATLFNFLDTGILPFSLSCSFHGYQRADFCLPSETGRLQISSTKQKRAANITVSSHNR